MTTLQLVLDHFNVTPYEAYWIACEALVLLACFGATVKRGWFDRY